MVEKLGLVQVYTGNGKGKTSASLGLSLRAVGQGFSVYMVQFLKSGDTGELFSVKKYVPNIKIAQFGKDALADKQSKVFEFDGKGELNGVGGTYHFPPADEEREPCRRALEHASSIIMSGAYDIVILDEINNAISQGIVDVQDVLNLIDKKPAHVELILTGRNAPKEVIERADLVSEIHEVKHPWRKGIQARRGIEY